jgi:O-antigen/teichoic acid export membrane protein
VDRAVSSVTAGSLEQPTSTVRGVARGSAVNVVGAAATAILSFVVVAVVTRGMTKVEAGEVFVATSLFVLVEALARLGADVGIVHHLSGALAQGRKRAASNVLLASLLPVTVGATVAGLVLLAVASPLEHLVAGHHGASHGMAIIGILAVSMPFAAAYDVMTAATRALGSTRPTFVVERLLRPIAQLVLIGVSIAVHKGPAVVVAAWTMPYLAAAVVMAIWLRALLRRAKVPLWSAEWPSQLRPVWTFTGPRAAASVLQMALQRLDILLVSAILGLPAAAVYTGATRFVVVGQLGNQAVGYSVQPQLRRLLVRDERTAAFELFQASTTWIVALTWPLYLTVIAMAPLLLRVFGRHYSGGATAAITVTAAMLVASACGLVDIALLTVGRSVWNLGNVALGLTVNVVIDLVLLPRIGIEGAAIGWAAAIVLCNLLPLWQINHKNRLHPFSNAWLRTMIVASVSFFGLPELGGVLHPGHSLGALGGLLIGSVLYVAVMWRARRSLGLDQILTRRQAGSPEPVSG